MKKMIKTATYGDVPSIVWEVFTSALSNVGCYEDGDAIYDQSTGEPIIFDIDDLCLKAYQMSDGSEYDIQQKIEQLVESLLPEL